jgi:hypothetical protein
VPSWSGSSKSGACSPVWIIRPAYGPAARRYPRAVSGTLSRCRACGRDTTTTDDWRCTYCGQPKPLTAEPAAAPDAAAEELVDPPAFQAPGGPPGLWEDLRPQLAAAALAALIALAGLLIGSALLLIAAAAILVLAVVTKILADGW